MFIGFEVECIAKGKMRSPYEFGCKVSLAINVNRAKAGHFILSARAVHGRPYDGHTLQSTIKDAEQNTGIEVKRIYVDKGYAGHDYENKLKVFKSGQRRGVYGQIKRELKRRSAIEPIIGHLKSDHKMNRCRLKGWLLGDKINAIFASIAFNFKQVLNFLKKFYHAFIQMLIISTISTKFAH